MCEAALSAARNLANSGSGGDPSKRQPKPKSPKDVPLGNGLVQNASLSISGRQRQVDDIVNSAQGLSISN